MLQIIFFRYFKAYSSKIYKQLSPLVFAYPRKLKRVSPIFSRVSFSSRRQSQRTFCDSECSSSCRGKFVARCRKHAMFQFWAIITGFLRHYTAKILIILPWLARHAKPTSWPRGKWKRFQLWYKRLKINLNLKNWTEEIKPMAHSLHSGTPACVAIITICHYFSIFYTVVLTNQSSGRFADYIGYLR